MKPPEDCSAKEVPLRLLAAAAGVVDLLLAPERAADFVKDCEAPDCLLAEEERLLAPCVDADCFPEDFIGAFVEAFVLAPCLAEAAPFLDVTAEREADFFEDDVFLD